MIFIIGNINDNKKITQCRKSS